PTAPNARRRHAARTEPQRQPNAAHRNRKHQTPNRKAGGSDEGGTPSHPDAASRRRNPKLLPPDPAPNTSRPSGGRHRLGGRQPRSDPQGDQQEKSRPEEKL